MPGTFRDADFPARPYPGARPDCSFVHMDGIGWPLDPVDDGWSVGGADLDGWLRDRGAPPLRGRTPVLAYGSNACPSKITWLRDELGLAGPVIALRVRCEGIAAVWAAGFRIVTSSARPPWPQAPAPSRRTPSGWRRRTRSPSSTAARAAASVTTSRGSTPVQ